MLSEVEGRLLPDREEPSKQQGFVSLAIWDL